MGIKQLNKNDYHKWIKKLINYQPTYGVIFDGKRIKYTLLTSVEKLTEKYLLSDLSIKSFIFPSVEKVFNFSENKNQITLNNIPLEETNKKILLGIRPCDAVGLSYLSFFFKNDKEDSIIQTKTGKTTVISYSCNKADKYCFCTSVKGNPGNIEGSDILLTKTDTGDYLVEVLSKKGEELTLVTPEYFYKNIDIVSKNEKNNYLANVPIQFEMDILEKKMKTIFKNPIFEQTALKCIGCQVCTFVCPTCTCFDIQDEKKGNNGYRVRCWDGCGSKLFTLHASGHNPRDSQGMRWRQRLMHKFYYLPKTIKKIGCVGCGRCSKHCPVGINLLEEINSILNT